MSGRAVAMLVVVAVLACGDGERSGTERFPMEGAGTLPFSAAVRVGSTLYVSGQLGTDSTLQLVSGGIGPETRQAMHNIRTILERAGATMDEVVKCTAMLADMTEWAAMNAEYVGFFPRGFPARSAFGVSGLAMDARVEIECIAALTGTP